MAGGGDVGEGTPPPSIKQFRKTRNEFKEKEHHIITAMIRILMVSIFFKSWLPN